MHFNNRRQSSDPENVLSKRRGTKDFECAAAALECAEAADELTDTSAIDDGNAVHIQNDVNLLFGDELIDSRSQLLKAQAADEAAGQVENRNLARVVDFNVEHLDR